MRKKYTLFTPGPVEMERDVLLTLLNPILYHREENFSKVLAALLSELRKVLFTKSKIFILTASGTGAMEACIQNLVSRHEKSLVITYGVFGERWREILWRYGAYTDEIAYPYGKSPPLEEIERRLRTNDEIKTVFTTLTDTSTGMLADIKSIGKICHDNARLLVVDAICGLGADEFYTDDWNVDVVCGASQKALAAPPGISFVCANEKAEEYIKKTKSPRYYFDFRTYERFLTNGQTPFTPAILTLYAFLAALKKVNRVGIRQFWKLHKERAEYFRKRLKGYEFLPEAPSNALTVLKMPEGKDATKIISEIKQRHNCLLANGQKDLRGKIIRVGHIGFLRKKDLAKVATILNKYREKF